MIQPTSRIQQTNKGIESYEQDILYDDYVYTGDFDMTLKLDYNNNGFGVILTNSEGLSLEDKEEVLLFKMGHKTVEIIYKNKNAQKVLGTYNAAYSKTCTEDLLYRLTKYNNKYTLYIHTQKICEFNSNIEFNSYNLAYYSNSFNIIKHISVAASIPYGWIVNMQNTNGGYIDFKRDSFELKYCKNNAEIEQINIVLQPGQYYLKYKIDESVPCDIKPYIFLSEDERLLDNNKNILNFSDGSFKIPHTQKVSLKFVGTTGKISKPFITTLRDNEYVRTSPDKGDKIDIKGSYIKLHTNKIKSFKFKGIVNHCPGQDHTSPYDYSIVNTNISYGLYDVDIALGVEYVYEFSNYDNVLNISNLNGVVIKAIKVQDNFVTIFKNVNAIITDFVVIDINGNNDNIIVENTIKKYVPGVIKSPIIVLDKNKQPLELSSSYRVLVNQKPAINKKSYIFTNTEREYFEPNHLIKLDSIPSDRPGSIIVYGIRHESDLDMNKLLYIDKYGKDTIDLCANYYDVLFEKDLRYIDRVNKQIRLNDVSSYKMIIVDYLKQDSYAINYNYEFKSYEVDISVSLDAEENISVVYDNTEKRIDDIEFINEQQYLDTKFIPSTSSYIVLGK